MSYIKTRSTSALRSQKGQDTKPTTVKWPIFQLPKAILSNDCQCEIFDMKITIYSHSNGTPFYMRDFTLALV